jgi:hypothetical protein
LLGIFGDPNQGENKQFQEIIIKIIKTNFFSSKNSNSTSKTNSENGRTSSLNLVASTNSNLSSSTNNFQSNGINLDEQQQQQTFHNSKRFTSMPFTLYKLTIYLQQEKLFENKMLNFERIYGKNMKITEYITFILQNIPGIKSFDNGSQYYYVESVKHCNTLFGMLFLQETRHRIANIVENFSEFVKEAFFTNKDYIHLLNIRATQFYFENEELEFLKSVSEETRDQTIVVKYLSNVTFGEKNIIAKPLPLNIIGKQHHFTAPLQRCAVVSHFFLTFLFLFFI